MPKQSFTLEMEENAVEVAKQLADQVYEIEKAMMPDGRPVFGEKVSEVARCAEYLLREGDPQAQYDYVSGLAASASARLSEFNVDPKAVHVWNVAYNHAVIESAELRGKMAANPVLYAEAMAEADRIYREQMLAQTPPMLG